MLRNRKNFTESSKLLPRIGFLWIASTAHECEALEHRMEQTWMFRRALVFLPDLLNARQWNSRGKEKNSNNNNNNNNNACDNLR